MVRMIFARNHGPILVHRWPHAQGRESGRGPNRHWLGPRVQIRASGSWPVPVPRDVSVRAPLTRRSLLEPGPGRKGPMFPVSRTSAGCGAAARLCPGGRRDQRAGAGTGRAGPSSDWAGGDRGHHSCRRGPVLRGRQSPAGDQADRGGVPRAADNTRTSSPTPRPPGLGASWIALRGFESKILSRQRPRRKM